VVKDNAIIDRDSAFCIDQDDCSVSRNIEYIKLLFSRAGLKVIAEERQRNFPPELYPVFMFALVPIENSIFTILR
jgi:protein N-terminal methyltransferase